MDSIIKGTTPPIQWKFSEISVSDIVAAFFTIRSAGSTILEKALTAADVNQNRNTLSWTLTQEETLALNTRTDYVLCLAWKLSDGTRGEGARDYVRIMPTGKDEVI